MESVNSFPRGVIIKWIINFMPIFNMYIFIFQKSFKKKKTTENINTEWICLGNYYMGSYVFKISTN